MSFPQSHPSHAHDSARPVEADITGQPPTPAGLSPRQASQARMRSSIACIRCRRSKVKCVNSGVGTTCRSCENSGRECAYPSPLPTGGTRRRDSLPGRDDGAVDGERRQRPRKSLHTPTTHHTAGPHESPRPLLDALDSRLLTPTVWLELFDIFQVHYSADLPFLHPPSFLKPLRRASTQPQSSTMYSDGSSSVRPAASEDFLLAFLALTARFHPKLVAHHSPATATRASNPLIASEYYAAGASARLSINWNEIGLHDIQRLQATLMLGLHDWGMCKGAKAWLTIGYAIRVAQAVGLQYEMDLDDEPLSRSLALGSEAAHMGLVDPSRKSPMAGSVIEQDAFVKQEIRRRTFWSCYIMDRYLSSGKYRPQMLHAQDLRIQLPASEHSFLFAERVRTLMLGDGDQQMNGRTAVQNQRKATVRLGTTGTPESSRVDETNGAHVPEADEDRGRLETGSGEGLVSRYVKVLQIYGKVIRWACAGGRRTEQHPPWDPRCEYNKLRRECLEFQSSLPRQHTLTPQNTQAHISLKTSTPYTLVHTVYLLCQIMLHREYVPFIPLRCSKPEGPLDPPLFPSDKYTVPDGYWIECARECFRAAREIMDLVTTCQEWNVLVQTPIVGFAIYTVAFVGVYCINFPWMDPDGYMCTQPQPAATLKSASEPSKESKGFEAAKRALEMIGHMRLTLHMADGWFKTINRMHRYFRRMKQDYRKNVQAIESGSSETDGSPLSTRQLSLREGGIGGGLDEYRLLERVLQDFGSLEDQDVEMADRAGPQVLETAYDDSSAGATVKSEEPDNRQGPKESLRTSSGPWNAINGAGTPTTGQRPSLSATSGAQFRSYESYQAPQRAIQPPPPPPLQLAQPAYAHQSSNFRPAAPPDTPGMRGPPSLTPPASHHASTPSQQSPPFDRQFPIYNTWAPQNTSYTMQQRLPAYMSEGPQPMGQSVPLHHASGYPAPMEGLQQVPSQSLVNAGPHGPIQGQPWGLLQKEAWLDSLDTRLGGDDVAAFVDGGELAEWASMSAGQGFGGDSWLHTIWSGPDGNR